MDQFQFLVLYSKSISISKQNLFFPAPELMLTPKKSSFRNDDFRKFDHKCVCQICTCGVHHCPPANLKFMGETTNHHDYKPYNISPQRYQPIQYHLEQRHYDPQILKTSYKRDYGPYRIQPYQSPVKYEYTQKKTPFYDETEYKKSYVPFQVVTERPHTTVNLDYRKKTKFEGTTTYQAQFSPKRVEKVSYSPLKYERQHIPFQGQTVYNSQYKPHRIQAVKPTTAYYEPYQGRRNKFLGESRYRQEYKPYQIENKSTCPVKLMPQLPRTCSPEKTHLNYSAQKRRWE